MARMEPIARFLCLDILAMIMGGVLYAHSVGEVGILVGRVQGRRRTLEVARRRHCFLEEVLVILFCMF
jgi:hypothetical protein